MSDVPRTQKLNAKYLYITCVVQCELSCIYILGEVKDLMLTHYTAHEQYNEGYPIYMK